MDLRAYIQEHFLLLDGAMGTMLQKEMQPGQRPDLLSITEPAIVESVHQKYFSAGSQLVYANTFGANAHKLKGSGYSVEEVVAASVAAAKKAAGTHGLVALDVGSLGELLEPAGSLPFEDAYRMFCQQMQQGAASGADCIVIETMSDLNEVRAAVLAAKETTALPVFVSMTFEPTHRTFTGCPVGAMGVLLESMGVDATGINCSLGPEEIFPIAEELSHWTTLPLLAKPNAGLPGPDGVYPVGPEAFAKQLESYLPLGVRLIGGCCGTSPETILRLKQMLAAQTPGSPVRSPVRAVCTATSVTRLDRTPMLLGDSCEESRSLVEEAFSSGEADDLLDLADELQDCGASLFLLREPPEHSFQPAKIASAITQLQTMCPMPLAFSCSHPGHLEAALRAYCGKAVAFLPDDAEDWFAVCKKYGAAAAVPCGEEPAAAWERLRRAGVLEQDRFLLVGNERIKNAFALEKLLKQCAARQIPSAALLADVSQPVEDSAIQTLLDAGVRLFLASPSNQSTCDFLLDADFS